jgi:hypothetical protein
MCRFIPERSVFTGKKAILNSPRRENVRYRHNLENRRWIIEDGKFKVFCTISNP